MVTTCTIITGEPNELVAQIHTRMPVIYLRSGNLTNTQILKNIPRFKAADL